LLDEIEKAHPDVKNVLLQIMDEGVLTDSNGVKVSFRNSILIMTSNCYSGYDGEHIVGFCKTENRSFEKRFKLARKTLSAELADRIDEVVIFEKLSVFALEKIAKLQSEKLSKRLAERGVSLGYDESFIKGSAERCYNKGGSAREIKRILTRETEELVSAHLLSGESENPSYECVDGIIYMKDGKSVFKKNSLCENESITFLK
jgi:ATP-dependent Clp protease ATP-binding subunit ClpC